MIFFSVAGKCLCGYEYITTIMMGAISFLLVDLIQAVFKKDRKKGIILFRTIFIIGIMAIAGFAVAICIHAMLRGNGNIQEGIQEIIKQDVLRRTNGADLNEFDVVYWNSFNASVWETLCQYFRFETEIITGVAGNLFPILSIIPLCIFVYDYKIRRMERELVAMYIVFFLTTISWFCLAKSHSYIHTHMNYVLWYFGFIQICLYIIVNRIVKAYNNIQQQTNIDKTA